MAALTNSASQLIASRADEDAPGALHAAGRAAPRARVVALDITKGALVVCMVIYHSLNYSTERWLGFQYLAFLPPSFILITGFLLSNLYLPRYSPGDWRLNARLISRGLRLILIFTILNVLVEKFVARGLHGPIPGLRVFWSHWFGIYVTGNARLAAFEILLPIGYFLIISPLFLVAARLHPVMLPLLTGAVLAFLAGWEHLGDSWLNPQMLSAGLVGMVLGKLSISQLNRLRSFRFVTPVLYAAYFIWTSIYGQDYLRQLLGAVLALALFYSWSAAGDPHAWLSRRLERLGRYSLVAYIGQIAILEIVSHETGHPEPVSLEMSVMFVATLVATCAGVELLHWLQIRSRGVSGLYKALFA